jgi:hypothetical protein
VLRPLFRWGRSGVIDGRRQQDDQLPKPSSSFLKECFEANGSVDVVLGEKEGSNHASRQEKKSESSFGLELTHN